MEPVQDPGMGAEFHKEEAPYNFYYRWKGSKMRKMKGSKNIPI